MLKNFAERPQRVRIGQLQNVNNRLQRAGRDAVVDVDFYSRPLSGAGHLSECLYRERLRGSNQFLADENPFSFKFRQLEAFPRFSNFFSSDSGSFRSVSELASMTAA